MIEDYAVCGPRGWFAPQMQSSEHDQKMYARELLRLKFSLEAAKQSGANHIIAMLHYPPIYEGYQCQEYLDLLSEYGVSLCLYGHLHAYACQKAVQGRIQSVEYRLVSADYLNFLPIKIA